MVFQTKVFDITLCCTGRAQADQQGNWHPDQVGDRKQDYNYLDNPQQVLMTWHEKEEEKRMAMNECDDFDDTLHMLIVMTPNLIQRGQQLLKFDSFDICNTKFYPDGTKTFKVW